MRAIDPHSGNAPYIEIANILRDAIDDGEFDDGDQLPSRTELADQFGVAPMTVSNAMRLLREEGAVTAIPGKGVFVHRQGEGRPSLRAEIDGIKRRLDEMERLLARLADQG